ncbi:MAG: hypothetical protein ACREVL_19150, partial [Solimonas sp.]
MVERLREEQGVSVFPSQAEAERFRLLAITPFERPDPALARVWLRYGAAVAVDLGRDPALSKGLFDELSRERRAGLGLRLADGVTPPALALPETVQFVVVAGSPARLPQAWRRVPVLAQVRSCAEAEQALADGAAGLIAKGQESGGLVGEESSFVLLQRLVELAQARGVRLWSQGGIALNTAAAAVAGGAFGVVIDA